MMIKLENIEKSYRLGSVMVPALRSVNLDIAAGDFAVLAGPSGSGKTTLLNLIGCIDKPDSGRILIQGFDVTDVPLSQLTTLRREHVGFIFQTFNLLPVLTAFENVEYPLLFSRLTRAQRHAVVWHWLEQVGLQRQAKHRPDQLSGGQRQRVAIARAMINEPSFVLADEPTANLDSETAGDILNLLEQINRQTGKTFLFSSHDPKLIDRATHQIGLSDGHIIVEEHAGQNEERLIPC